MEVAKPLRVEIKVSGIVQGVGFRPFIYRIAKENSLVGFVRNRGDALVEIVVEGKGNNVKNFLEDLKNPPPLARIDGVITNYFKDEKNFEQFTIMKSSKNAEISGSIIPPDVSICDECLSELRDPKDKRHNYFFITCTNCGPRYTIINRLPYDRTNTTMQSFLMCDFCSNEYRDPSNRRFHAQTVACPECGPRVYLTTNNGEPTEHKDSIREVGRLLEEGYVVAIKGNGGFHIATSTLNSKPIERLRKTKHRSQKPFAIMTRDLETIRSFTEVSRKEAELLTSYVKPIVLLKKSREYYLSELISPDLHNIGVMLPYTGLHTMLFDDVNEPAFVMTSANPPDEPIVTDNTEAIEKLGAIADYFLFHNRKIAHRCDDSVVRIHGENLSIIRRSRGYAPAPIRLKRSTEHCILGLGAEINVTACILLRNQAFISQHIGDVENLSTLDFLKRAIDHLMRLTNTKVQIIACDLHPKFTTTKLAQNLGEQLNLPVIPIQHHHAQLASLMGEHDIDEIIGIVCDGFGYGSDGSAWGGEILHCNHEGFERLGHLQEHPMVGGDLATFYPLRMAAGILYDGVDVTEWLLLNSHRFPHGKREVEVILKQLEDKSTIKTTSCGRILDAISAILGVCYERTYEGEPAMKLESTALNGKDVLNLKPKLDGNVIDTSLLVSEIFDKRKKHSIPDLAYSAQAYIAKSLAELAIKKAKQLNIRLIGFSGGVAYNEHITTTIKKNVERDGLKFIVHHKIPPGDEGISFGQTVAAAFQTPETRTDLF